MITIKLAEAQFNLIQETGKDLYNGHFVFIDDSKVKNYWEKYMNSSVVDHRKTLPDVIL